MKSLPCNRGKIKKVMRTNDERKHDNTADKRKTNLGLVAGVLSQSVLVMIVD
jgi:hypothetical protein